MSFSFTEEQLHPSENRLATYMKTLKDDIYSLYDKYGQDNFILLNEIERIIDKFEQSLQRNPLTKDYLNEYNPLGTITELTSSCILKSFVQRKKYNELNNKIVMSSFARGLGNNYDIYRDLVNSEMNYFSSLVFIYETYYKQLNKKNEDKKQILYEKQMSKLFQNFDEIKENAKNMLKKLEIELRKWPEGTPLIGSAFLSSKTVLKESFIKYGSGIVKAIKFYYKFKKSVESFTQFLNSVSLKDPSRNPESQLSLPTLLMLPLDRVIEYHNFLKDLLKCTSYNHDDYQDIQAAQEYMESIYLAIKDYRVEALKIQKQFNSKGKVPYILSLSESRRLIREGPVNLVLESKSKKCAIYLFSDIILILERNDATENKLFHDIIWVKGSIIKELDSEDEAYLFIIFNSNKKIVLSTNTRSERISWIKDIELARKASEMPSLPLSPVQIRF